LKKWKAPIARIPGMKALLLLALLAQQEEIIQKAYKHVYMQAASDCNKAIDLLEEDPAEAITLLTPILENSKVKKRECLLRIEIMPGTYSRKHRFFPYKYRRRAGLILGEKTGDPEKAKRFFRDAEQDLEESVGRRNCRLCHRC
jgi:hypothetical protein